MVFAYACGEKGQPEFQADIQQLKSLHPDELITDTYRPGNQRPEGLDRLVMKIRQGDELVFPRLTATGRTAKQLVSLMALLSRRGVKVASLAEGLDTKGEKGAAIEQFVQALTVLDKDLRKQATAVGLDLSGKTGSRAGTHNQQNAKVVALLYQQGRPIKEIMEKAKVKSRETVYRYLDLEGIERRNKKNKN